MKRIYLPLALSSCLMVACQSAPPQIPTPNQAPLTQEQALLPAPVSIPEPHIAKVQYTPKPAPFGQVEALPDQKLAIHFTYPEPQAFRTQAFGCGEVAYASVAVTGPALGNQTLYANGSDGVHHMFAASNCQISATVDAVPYGDLVATIRLYDADRNLLAGSELVSGFHVSATNPVVQMSYRQTSVGQILNALRGNNQVEDEFLAGQLDLNDLQSFIDTLTGVSGNFPNYTFTTHPALVNIPAIVADLKAQNGDISALNPASPQYIYAAGTARFTLAGLLNGDSLDASIDDVLSADATINSNGEVIFNNLPPGTWTLRLSGNGYIDQRITVTVQAGEQTELGTLNIAAVAPTLTSLTPSTGVSGSSTIITGTNFHLTASNNTVRFGQTLATVTNATATELTVTVPNGLTLGNQSVTITKGLGQASNGLDYTVVRPEITQINVSAGEIGSQVVITGTNFNPTEANNTVRFNGVQATVDAASSTELTVTVPSGIFGNVPITVSNLQSPASDAETYAVTPTITGLSAATGSSGDTLTLTGNGFDTTSANNTVNLGSHVIANPVANSTTQIQVTLPNVPANIANATVQVGTQTSAANAAANFAFAPHLSALATAETQDSKAVLIRDQILTITGTNFDPTAGNNIIDFGGITAAASTATATQLTVTVPGTVNTPGDVAVSVTTNAQSSNSLTAIVPTLNLNFNGEFK